MSLQTATNPTTGETVALVGGRWVPVRSTATNERGEKAYLVGNEWIVPESAQEPPAPKGSFLGDLARSFGQGAAGAAGAIASAFGADTAPAQYLDETAKNLGKGLSAERQAELRMQAERMKRAEASGSTWEEIKAGAMNVAEAPLQSAAQAVGSLVPILVTIPLTKLGVGALGIRAALGALGAAQGAGAAKQSIYEAVEAAEIQEGKSPEQARAAAVRAQEYIGENWDTIAANTGLGVVAGTTGVERLVPGATRAAAGKAQQALAKRIGERGAQAVAAGIGEAPLEGAQGAAERIAANIALQRTGRDVDTFTGAAGAATQEALMGGLGGAAVGAAVGPQREPEEAAPPGAPATTPSTAAPDPARAALDATAQEYIRRDAERNSPEYLWDLKQRYDAQVREEEAMQGAMPAANQPGYKEAQAALKAKMVEGKSIKDEYAELAPRIAEEIEKRRDAGLPVDTAPAPEVEPEMPETPAEPEVAPAPVAPAPTTTFTPRPVAQIEAEIDRLNTELESLDVEDNAARIEQLQGDLEVLAWESGKRIETLNKGTQRWLKSPKGIEFLEKIKALAPEQVEPMRQTLKPGTGPRSAFDAYFGTEPTAERPADIRPEPETAGPSAEPSVGVPSGSVGEPGTAPAPAEPAQAPDVSGVVGSGEAADGSSGPVAPELGSLTLEQINARTAELTQLQSGRRPRGGPALEAYQARARELAQLNEIRDEMFKQQRAAQTETVPQDGTQTTETQQAETQGPEAEVNVQAPPAESAATAPEGGLPEPGATTQPVETAGVRTVAEIDAELNPILDERNRLQNEQRALLTKAGRMPAANSPARQRWDAIADQIEALEAKGDPLLNERAKARRATQTTETPPKAEPKPKPKPKPEPKPEVKDDAQQELDDLQSALDIYNAPPADKPSEAEQAKANAAQERAAINAVRYLLDMAEGTKNKAPKAVRERAREILDSEIDSKDIERARSRAMYRRDEKGNLTSGMEVDDIRARVAALLDGWTNAPEVNVVEFDSDLPDHIYKQMLREGELGRINGVFDNGTVYLIANNIPNAETLALTVTHEVAGHYGLRGVLGPDYAAAMMMVYRGNTDIRQAVEQRRANGALEDTATLTEEVLATMQETASGQPWYAKLINRVKARMASVFGVPKDTFTNAQVDQLLADAANWARGGRRAATMEAKRAMYRQNQVATPAALTKLVRSSEIMKDAPGPLRRAATGMMQAYVGADGVSLTTRFRAAVVDAKAPVVERLNALFDGAVRSGLGLINPEGLMRQADDAQQLLLPFIRKGWLVFDPDLAQWKATDVPKDSDQKSMEQVLKDVEAWGKARGMDFREASATLSKMFEAQRLDGLRKYNADLPEGQPRIPIQKLSRAEKNLDENQQIDIALEALNADPAAQAIKKSLDAVKNHLVDHMISVGRISYAEGKAWKEALDYVPFDRIKDLDKDQKFNPQRRIGKGSSQLGNLPELIGTTQREVGDVFQNSVGLQGWMISQVVRQDATSHGLKMLAAIGAAKRKGEKPLSDTSKQVMTYERGVKVYYEMDNRYLVMAFVEPTLPRGPFIQFAQSVANFFRKTITAMPPFAVLQLTKDIYRGFAQSGVKNPYALVFPAITNFVRISGAEFLGKKHPMLNDVNAKGIGGGYDIDMRDPADGVLQELGLRQRGAFSTAIHKLDAITRASDVAVRLAIYNQTKKETGDRLLATTRAREFINFRRRGAHRSLPTLVAVVPFLNAYLQGMDVLYRQATGKGASSGLNKVAAQRAFFSRMGQLAGLSLLYSWAVSGTDDYEELDLLTRMNNYIIPGTPIKVPMANELGALIKVPFEAGYEYFRKLGTPEEIEAAELTATVMRYAFDQFAMGAYPAILKPLVENLTNYSFFTGRELVGTYQQSLDPAMRRNTQTSEFAIAVSNVGASLFGPDKTVSPIMIDNFLKGYAGSAYTTFTMATDQALNPDKLDRPMSKYWMLSVFMYDREMDSRDKNAAYEWNEKAARRLNTMRRLADQDVDKAAAYYAEHKDAIDLGMVLEKTMKDAGELRRFINDMNSNPQFAAAYTPEEREAYIKSAREVEKEIFGQLRSMKNQIRDVNAQ